MKSLLQLFSHWVNWLGTRRRNRLTEEATEPPQGPFELAPSDTATRFIYSRSHIRKSDARPKPGAFSPPPSSKLSVAHSTGLPNSEVWKIGSLTLGTQPGRDTIYARADVPVRSFNDRKLRAIRDDIPFKRHTSVIGWPQSADADEAKRLRLQICLELSVDPEIVLVVPTSPITRIANPVSRTQ
jgi:hypothetical protein